VREWGSPLSLGLILACQAVAARFALRELFPVPSMQLIQAMLAIAIVNFIIKVLWFARVRNAPRTQLVTSWPEKLKGKRLSIIIPAYDEAETIGATAKAALMSTKSSDVELVVVDDRSKDKTWEVLQAVLHETQDRRFKPVSGGDRGQVFWKGKNWACTQGYEAATGDYLLFLDADVTLLHGAVESFLHSMAESDPNVGWISFVPKTRFSCLAEYMFNWPGTMIAQTLIPNAVNSGKKTYAFGQCNLFERNVYERLGGHREVGHLIAESHALAARARELHVPMRCELAFEHAHLEWYATAIECWKGQLKSVRGRMSQPLPVLGRPPPRPIVSALMSLFFSWQTLPWALAFLQAAKVLEATWSLRDSLLLAACLGSIFCSFLNRLLGWIYLGYDMKFWWLAPVVSSLLHMLLAIRACRPDNAGRWNDSALPEGFSLPCEVKNAEKQ